VLQQAKDRWESMDAETRAHVHLVLLPMDDLEENAVIVNALQRGATVVVQKSLAEGFGLTVAEAMWKARPIVASAVGGISDQIAHGVHGLLVDDPEDLVGFGHAVESLLCDRIGAEQLGKNARDRAAAEFLGDRHLEQYGHLLAQLA
jgi:trehalose synthase